MKKGYWKFLKEDMHSMNGDTEWVIGEWQHQKGKMELCENGFHCSTRIYQAFSYVQGEILAEVEVKGKSNKSDNKECWSDMRMIKTWKWQKKDSVALAIYAAELVLDIFEKEYPKDKRPRKAITAAKKWLKKPTDKNMDAAGDAARDARDAAWAARMT